MTRRNRPERKHFAPLAIAVDAPSQDNHIEKARRAIHTLHTAHDEAATLTERIVDRTTALLGRPPALICIALAIAAWMGGNSLAGSRAIDPFPFQELEFAISAAALVIAILILASQRRAGRLADARETMTLELSLQNAQKVSKIIELLEEFRRDSPNLPDRPDPEAADMSSSRAETEVLENTPTPPDSARS
jgi:uncharacterized membrane protein